MSKKNVQGRTLVHRLVAQTRTKETQDTALPAIRYRKDGPGLYICNSRDSDEAREPDVCVVVRRRW